MAPWQRAQYSTPTSAAILFGRVAVGALVVACVVAAAWYMKG